MEVADILRIASRIEQFEPSEGVHYRVQLNLENDEIEIWRWTSSDWTCYWFDLDATPICLTRCKSDIRFIECRWKNRKLPDSVLDDAFDHVEASPESFPDFAMVVQEIIDFVCDSVADEAD